MDIHPVRKPIFVCPSNKGDCAAFDIRHEKLNKDKLMDPVVSYTGETTVGHWKENGFYFVLF